jgi:hypothetical protein
VNLSVKALCIELINALRAGQIPSNMMLNRVRPSWYMASFCLAWSIVSLLTFLANSFSSMVALRFILGITEAPVSYFLLNDKRRVVLIFC